MRDDVWLLSREIPSLHTRFKKGQSGNPRGRPQQNLAALLAAALNEKVTATVDGKRKQVTKREAVITQLVNKSASAELRATKMLIDLIRDIEKKADPAPAEKSPFSPTDREVVHDREAAPRYVPRLSAGRATRRRVGRDRGGAIGWVERKPNPSPAIVAMGFAGLDPSYAEGIDAWPRAQQ
jgi:hypothetical protein